MAVELIMMKGLPASGKSTWAKEKVLRNASFVRVNKDLLREMLHAGHWTKANEKVVVATRDQLVQYHLGEGRSVIVDDTNLAPEHEERLRMLAGLKRARFSVQDFTSVPLEDCIARDVARERGHVGEAVIRRMWNDYLKPKPEVYVPPEGKPHVMLVDMDGTWALPGGRDPYKDWLCENDEVNEAVNAFVTAYASVGGLIIVMSGRDEGRALAPTLKWLMQRPVKAERVLMRKAGDTRKDAIVKRELFEAHVRPYFHVDLVLDDRQQVVDMWRSLGLTVWQVAEGDF